MNRLPIPTPLQSPPTTLQYPEDARNRIQDGLRKYSRIVAQARQRGMNEGDTADIVKAMLGDMLGYDPFFDVTAEVSVRGPLADYAVLVEGRLRLLLIVKATGTVPSATHLLRLSGAAAPPYAEWALLSNADVWACYRLGVGPDRHPELAFRTGLLDPTPPDEKTKLFFLMSKESVAQDGLALYWEQTRVLNSGRMASLILSNEILNLMRREILRTANYRIDRHTLQEFLMREVLRPEALTARQGENEAGGRKPECFAYVGDANNPTTWRARYRNPDGSPNAELLTLAVAELSGDARNAGIPADDIPLVKERLRNAYLELGVSQDELPEYLRF